MSSYPLAPTMLLIAFALGNIILNYKTSSYFFAAYFHFLFLSCTCYPWNICGIVNIRLSFLHVL